MSHPTEPKPSLREAPRPDSGFSLVELMVALVVTLIVSGAVYGLLTSGQSAFRKEPAMADRQANIRAAMDMIVSDLRGAGVGMPPFTLVFTPGLDGPAGSENAPGGGLTDELEFITETSSRTGQLICFSDNTTIVVPEPDAPFEVDQSFLIFLADSRWTARKATAVNKQYSGAVGTCSATGTHTQVEFAAGGINVAAGICAAGQLIGTTAGGTCPPQSFSFGRVVGYRIRYDGTQTPSLERQTSDDWGTWLPVLPGIEDLQVRYQGGAGLGPPPAFKDVPETPDAFANVAGPQIDELNKLVRQVEVTLGARALGPGLTGQQTAAGVANAPRGRLQSITAMRPVFEVLAQPGPPPLPLFR
jgi:prepilin-type N-terminal cleavage/methylation domain-containing protein